MLALVISEIPKTALFTIFSGLAIGLSQGQVGASIAGVRHAVGVLAGFSLPGAAGSPLRPSRQASPAVRQSREQAG
ncbi:MAG: hypothetical protein IRZ20_02875 [Thermoleophilia bacterium]|nr:hypothetical protein [Thermoleophilia bacterium]